MWAHMLVVTGSLKSLRWPNVIYGREPPSRIPWQGVRHRRGQWFGKTTLLRIMTGEETASTGDVTIPRKARVGVIEQNHFKYEDTRILDVVMMGNDVLWNALSEADAMCSGDPDAFDVDRYGELQETIEQLGGYQLESHAAEVLNGLNIPTEKHDQLLSTLSGGYKLRVLLAQVLRPPLIYCSSTNRRTT